MLEVYYNSGQYATAIRLLETQYAVRLPCLRNWELFMRSTVILEWVIPGCAGRRSCWNLQKSVGRGCSQCLERVWYMTCMKERISEADPRGQQMRTNEWKQMTRQYGKNGKQSHIERFFYRFSGHRQDTASLPERLEDPVYVRFDYTRRDPLDHQAQHEYLEYSGNNRKEGENRLLEDYVVIDLEMTGLNAKTDAILEVGAVRVRDGRQTETYGAILKCGRELSERVVELTGITPEMAADGREPEEAMQEFFTFLGDDVLVGQNVIFDYSFLKQWSVNHGQTFERNAVDTLKLARRFLPAEQKKDLESLCTYFGIGRERAHRALDDAMATGIVLERLKQEYGTVQPEAFLPYALCYRTKKQTPATGRQMDGLKKYAAHYGIPETEIPEQMTRSEASRLLDRWIAVHGRMPRD